MTSLPRMQGGVTSLSQGVQECLAFNLKTPGNLELNVSPARSPLGWGGWLEEGVRQLRLLFLEGGCFTELSRG